VTISGRDQNNSLRRYKESNDSEKDTFYFLFFIDMVWLLWKQFLKNMPVSCVLVQPTIQTLDAKKCHGFSIWAAEGWTFVNANMAIEKCC
jgi:hypothetical protein